MTITSSAVPSFASFQRMSRRRVVAEISPLLAVFLWLDLPLLSFIDTHGCGAGAIYIHLIFTFSLSLAALAVSSIRAWRYPTAVRKAFARLSFGQTLAVPGFLFVVISLR